MASRYLPLLLIISSPLQAANQSFDCDLLIVGGTESGCAAAVQAARMGVEKIILVNDIAWLGGQFSSEALMAIDENTDLVGERHSPPIPRHGLFKEVIERIEDANLKKYGVARPGNTRVITTCRPAEAEQVFTDLLEPYVKRGQVVILDNFEPVAVTVSKNRLQSVRFLNTDEPTNSVTINANLCIDASDWGDVIRLSGAAYEFGPDLKSKYDEPLAPAERKGYPATDMNPITYCMVLEETNTYEPIPRPKNYDRRNYVGKKDEADWPIHYLEWKYPNDASWLYGSRRLVDHYKYPQIQSPDVVLLCFPAIDYPLDVYPQAVADALEAAESGASQKNIAQLSPQLRRIIFEDAKLFSLGFLYYLQTDVHDRMADQTHSFRRFKLSEEFGTPDHMPFKPYVRESLRMKAMYMMRQQDTSGINNVSSNFAQQMYHDGVAVWQFEYDFHPTGRKFIDNGDPTGPWQSYFRKGRTWGPPYSGRSLFSLRSLIPESLDGLLGAQKNVGFSSIVSSAVRLHDQSMAVGQASGATAAIALKHDIAPRKIPFDREKLIELQLAIASKHEAGQPAILWPFRDLDSQHPSFTAINLLAIQGCLPIRGDEVDFQPDQPATQEWIEAVVNQTRTQLKSEILLNEIPLDAKTRGEFANRWWKIVRHQTWKSYVRQSDSDADGDGIVDQNDALPLDSKNSSLPTAPVLGTDDGLPDPLADEFVVVKQFNFTGRTGEAVAGFLVDRGEMFDTEKGYGWARDISANVRQRKRTKSLADTYVFTRTHDVWECNLPEGKYHVTVSVGDAAHKQAGQNVTVEKKSLIRNHFTSDGQFAERTAEIQVRDGRLTVEIGFPGKTTNTCLNWIRITRKK